MEDVYLLHVRAEYSCHTTMPCARARISRSTAKASRRPAGGLRELQQSSRCTAHRMPHGAGAEFSYRAPDASSKFSCIQAAELAVQDLRGQQDKLATGKMSNVLTEPPGTTCSKLMALGHGRPANDQALKDKFGAAIPGLRLTELSDATATLS